jgi:putative monooxygenase
MLKLKCNCNNVSVITKRGDEVRVLISPKTVGATQLIMGKAILPGMAKVDPHVHDHSEETFFVLKGQGIIHLKGLGIIKFSEGDAVLVPKGIEHWVENTLNTKMEIIFASAPLAPNPEAGHRDLR